MSIVSCDFLDSSCDSRPKSVLFPAYDASRPSMEFCIDVSVNFQRLNVDVSEEDEENGYGLGSPKQIKNNFLSSEISSSTISMMLSEMFVNAEPFMIENIKRCAEQMVIEYRDVIRPKIFCMDVVIDVFVEVMPLIFHDANHVDDADDVEETIEESFDEVTGMVPASRSAIEGLEMVRGEDWETCGVCLASVAACDKVAQLPCEHVYHGGCITRWLEMSNVCPLCRFRCRVIELNLHLKP